MSTLYISTTSPYTRILLSIAYLKGIELELRFVVPWENPSELTAANPFSQVPALVWDNGDVVTETPLIIQALAPEIYTHNPAYDLPRISRAFGILSQGVRAYSTERFGLEGQALHPFVARSKKALMEVLPILPTLSADSGEWGDRILLCALIWTRLRLPDVFAELSDENRQAVELFSNSGLMQKLTPQALEKQPKTVADL